MAEPVSGHTLAKLFGVSETAVRKAIKAGRIARLPSGLIDPDAARKAWSGETDPARSKVRTEARTKAKFAGKVRTQGSQASGGPRELDQALALIERVLREEGIADDGEGIDFAKARTAELILKARQRNLDQAEQSGRLVDRAAAMKLFFDTSRENRDAWLAWPARIAITMAEDIQIDRQTGKVDARSLTKVLHAAVHQHLTEMGEPHDPTFG